MVVTTGPILNSAVNGLRPVQMVTVKMINRSLTQNASILIQGYVLDQVRTIYVEQLFNLNPNAVFTNDYIANVDGYEFKVSVEDHDAIEVSVWGKDGAGHIVSAHRLVSSEL
ncbi:hypothetical protein ACFSVM_08320 [Paenibacillus shunpengii]|uniref:Uncharacterized protein n=1 Tax=Paenibacillus shunpengii TaxID=2054424 RepID=A0ABW5SMG4_9BACL|nr:hypothetical protein [Paenibacillus sp. PDC88]SDW04966.1 hypothetical protein SAMN05518848_10185 [Paenibacillus sp. PDC88]